MDGNIEQIIGGINIGYVILGGFIVTCGYGFSDLLKMCITLYREHQEDLASLCGIQNTKMDLSPPQDEHRLQSSTLPDPLASLRSRYYNPN